MADTRSNTSRRALLGILAAAPVLATTAAATAANPSWDAAIAHLDRARAAYSVACAAHGDSLRLYDHNRPALADVGHFAVGDTIEAYNVRVRAATAERLLGEAACRSRYRVDELKQEAFRAEDALQRAVDTVLAMPAPNLAAVARKIKIAGEHGRAAADLVSVLADLRRLENRS